MDAYLICPEARTSMWLGKPIRSESDERKVIYYNQKPSHDNHEDALLNKVLWKFLAEHAHKELRVVFDGEFVDDDYERIQTSDVEAEEYVKDWPPND